MTFTLHGWAGTLAVALALAGLVSLLCSGVDAVAWLLPRIPFLRREVTAPAATDGRNILRAVVRGASIPELESAALDRGRDLYGLDADLTVASVENVATSPSGEGLVIATVYVRRIPAAGNVSAHEAGTP